MLWRDVEITAVSIILTSHLCQSNLPRITRVGGIYHIMESSGRDCMYIQIICFCNKPITRRLDKYGHWIIFLSSGMNYWLLGYVYDNEGCDASTY